MREDEQRKFPGTVLRIDCRDEKRALQERVASQWLRDSTALEPAYASASFEALVRTLSPLPQKYQDMKRRYEKESQQKRSARVGVSWGCLGGVLGESGECLEGLWGILGARVAQGSPLGIVRQKACFLHAFHHIQRLSWRVSGGSWGVLGVSWECLGRSWGIFGGSLGDPGREGGPRRVH